MTKIRNFNYLCITFLISFGIFFHVQAQNGDNLRQITRMDPTDLYEGLTYERFNFLNTFLLPGHEASDSQQCWNSCQNTTGINKFINAKRDVNETMGCLGEVLSCSDYSQPIDDTVSVIRNSLKIIGTKVGIFYSPAQPKCQSCNCTCLRTYEPSNQQTRSPELLDSICLDNITANLAENFVVTGVRLTRLNNTLTFQIQEGQILEGIIDQTKIRWQPLPKKCHEVGKMSFKDRTIVLDDVILPRNWVVTGVAFKRHGERDNADKSVEENPFYLSVIGHKLDEKLNLQHQSTEVFTKWNFSLNNRANLVHEGMALPILNRNNVQLSSSGKNYVTFEMIEPENDVRNFIAPYVDSQKVRMTPIAGDFDNNDGRDEYPSILRGIGLYYKGYHSSISGIDYGGYIAPSIFVPER